MTIRYCKDCTHSTGEYTPEYPVPRCRAPESNPPVDLVSGQNSYPSAARMRREEDKCGSHASWFVAKPPSSSVFLKWFGHWRISPNGATLAQWWANRATADDPDRWKRFQRRKR